MTRKRRSTEIEDFVDPCINQYQEDSDEDTLSELDPMIIAPSTEDELKIGYIVDYISEELVKATPEQIESVQVFSRRLVGDYGYSKLQIQTRPQFRVRKRPSDKDKSYPIDIAVFENETKIEDNLKVIVECKAKNRKDGISQLKLYLDMSPAEIGVWFNGKEHAYLRKVYFRDGRREYVEIPNIPRNGENIEDIGLYRRRDLKRPSNLKSIFRDIRNHLAGNSTGITRDEAFAQQIINILFCKIYDEINTGMDEMVTFRSGIDEDPKIVAKRILDLFNSKVKVEYSDVFTIQDTISLDAASLVYVIGELQSFSLIEADRDAVGDAFEVFISPALRGGEGQFFTPRNVVNMVVKILNPQPGELIIDPACGSGGFLIMALTYVWQCFEEISRKKGMDEILIDRRKREIASKCFRGIDKDSFLAKVTKAYMAIIGDGRGGIFCENSLLQPEEWQPLAQESIKSNSFNVVMTNPPFGSKIPIKGQKILAQYDLGHKWAMDKKTRRSVKTDKIYEEQPPQILFLERCRQLLAYGGRMGIVLPESILGNPSYEYIITWILENMKIHGIVTMPEALFKTSGKGGTHTKVCVMFLENLMPRDRDDYSIFMADAKWCGHDSRGNATIRREPNGNSVLLDDIPLIENRYWELMTSGRSSNQDHLGFYLRRSQIQNQILVPKYYDPEITSQLQCLAKTHDLLPIKDLVENEVIEIRTGIEVGKMAYGTGPIPFIRTSDISNWELKADPKHAVSEELYESLKDKLDVMPCDILMVRDGTYLIGTSAIVTELDTKILFQSHIYKIRVLRPDRLNPWLLFAALNSPIVKKQIKSKQFTQDIIDTLGNRIFELKIPIPKDISLSKKIAEETKIIVETRANLRDRAKQISFEVDGTTNSDDSEMPPS